MAWRLAKSLDKLRNQVNAAYPGRNKASDGTIGDAAHRAGQSDHNPDKNGVVRALDLTHDMSSGMDAGALANAIIESRDPRVSYLIWNKKILVPSWPSGWTWQAYNGDNPHTKHIHISVHGNFDDTKDWRIGMAEIIDLNIGRQLSHGLKGENGLNGGNNALLGGNDDWIKKNLVGKPLTLKLIDDLYNSDAARKFRDEFLPSVIKDRNQPRTQTTKSSDPKLEALGKAIKEYVKE